MNLGNDRNDGNVSALKDNSFRRFRRFRGFTTLNAKHDSPISHLRYNVSAFITRTKSGISILSTLDSWLTGRAGLHKRLHTSYRMIDCRRLLPGPSEMSERGL